MSIKIEDLSFFEGIDDNQVAALTGGGEPKNCQEYYDQRNQRVNGALNLAKGSFTLGAKSLNPYLIAGGFVVGSLATGYALWEGTNICAE